MTTASKDEDLLEGPFRVPCYRTPFTSTQGPYRRDVLRPLRPGLSDRDAVPLLCYRAGSLSSGR